MKSKVFLRNTAVLTATSLLLRLMGMFTKVYLAARIGAEGMGLYGLVIPLCALAAAFGSVGMSAAVTRTVAERPTANRSETKGILKRAFRLVTVGALGIGGVLFAAAPLIARYLFCEPAVAPALRIFCLSLPFKGYAALLKGYFYGKKKSVPPSFSQIFESTLRLSLLFVMFHVKQMPTPTEGLLLLVTADAVGDTASFFVLIPFYRRFLRQSRESVGGDPPPLLSVALPITGSAALSTGLHFTESVLIPSLLTVYTGVRSVSVGQFGILKGMVLPLLFFPSSFLSALATLLLPEFSEAVGSKSHLRLRAITERTVGPTLLIGILLAAWFYSTAAPLGNLFFSEPEVGEYLKILAVIVPFMYLESIVSGMLKGLGEQKAAFRINLFDSTCRLLLSGFAVPRWGMRGFLAVMIVSNITTSSLSTARVFRVSGTSFRWRNWVIYPALSALGSMAVARFVTTQAALDGLPFLAVTGIVEALLYAAGLLALGVLPVEAWGEWLRRRRARGRHRSAGAIGAPSLRCVPSADRKI